jgi:peptidoglycan/LPS O-acetylase OafA/YrhL
VKVFGTIYRFWVTLVWLAVVLQIMFAAYGGFYSADKLADQKGSDETKMISEKTFDHGWDLHTGFGYTIFLGAVLLFLIALAARLGKRRVLLALAVPLAVVLQIVLAWISEDAHGVGLLHGLNALVIFGLTGSMAGMAWRQHRAAASAEAPTPTPT